MLVSEPFIHHKSIDQSKCRMVEGARQGPDNIEPSFFHRTTATSLLEATKLNCIALKPIVTAVHCECSHICRAMPMPRAPDDTM